MASGAAAYPVTFDVDYPERLSRWKIFVKWLLAFPHLIVLYLLAGQRQRLRHATARRLSTFQHG